MSFFSLMHTPSQLWEAQKIKQVNTIATLGIIVNRISDVWYDNDIKRDCEIWSYASCQPSSGAVLTIYGNVVVLHDIIMGVCTDLNAGGCHGDHRNSGSLIHDIILSQLTLPLSSLSPPSRPSSTLILERRYLCLFECQVNLSKSVGTVGAEWCKWE